MLNFIPLLKHMDLFKEFSSQDMERLFTIDSFHIEHYKKDSIIYLPNEICTTIDIILKGMISVQGVDENGNYVLISTFIAGNVIGENLLFSHKNFYPMMVLSKTPVTLLHLKKALVINLCQSNTTFLSNFLVSLSDKTLILTDKIKTLSFKSLRQCIVDFLTYEYYVQNTNIIKLELTKKDLAEKFGVQRSSLSRELNKMRKDGLIEYNAYSITILDISLLLKY